MASICFMHEMAPLFLHGFLVARSQLSCTYVMILLVVRMQIDALEVVPSTFGLKLGANSCVTHSPAALRSFEKEVSRFMDRYVHRGSGEDSKTLLPSWFHSIHFASISSIFYPKVLATRRIGSECPLNVCEDRQNWNWTTRKNRKSRRMTLV